MVRNRRRDEDSFYGPEHADSDMLRAIIEDHESGLHEEGHGGCPRCPR